MSLDPSNGDEELPFGDWRVRVASAYRLTKEEPSLPLSEPDQLDRMAQEMETPLFMADLRETVSAFADTDSNDAATSVTCQHKVEPGLLSQATFWRLASSQPSTSATV
jgi:hypothetical protein